MADVYPPIMKVEPKLPRTWEYEFLDFTGADITGFKAKLDAMGEQGWEMTESFQLHNVFFFVMKRESTDVPKEGK